MFNGIIEYRIDIEYLIIILNSLYLLGLVENLALLGLSSGSHLIIIVKVDVPRKGLSPCQLDLLFLRCSQIDDNLYYQEPPVTAPFSRYRLVV